MLAAWLAGLQGQLGSDQHGIQPVHRHGRQHLRHDPVAAFMAQQDALQLLERLGQVSNGAPLRRAPGLRSIRLT
jgi:hypothetical protein